MASCTALTHLGMKRKAELRISNRMTPLLIIRYNSSMLVLLVAGVALTYQITADSESESFGIVTVSQVLLNVRTCRDVGPRDHEGRGGGRGCGGDSVSGTATCILLIFMSRCMKIGQSSTRSVVWASLCRSTMRLTHAFTRVNTCDVLS